MHFCGIIIKPKNLGIEEARTLLGDLLVERGFADWYSTDDYRERLFSNGKREITLKEFKEEFTEWLKDLKEVPEDVEYVFNAAWPLCFIYPDNYIDEYFLPYEFFDFYRTPERTQLINLYTRAYKKYTMKLIDSLLMDDEEYTVVLLDYHF
jgi:hypothetical protein